jgi:hypothetical protein
MQLLDQWLQNGPREWVTLPEPAQTVHSPRLIENLIRRDKINLHRISNPRHGVLFILSTSQAGDL